MRTALALFLALTLALASIAARADYRASASPPPVLYDAPSRAAKPLYVVTRYYPLEVIVNLDAWVKVRDQTGQLTWIERKLLVDQRTVVVTAPSTEVRVRPEDGAPVAFVAAQNVALEYLGTAPGGWLRVRHPDGANGYVRADQVWGA